MFHLNYNAPASYVDYLASHYARVKPIVSKYHKYEDDIRPLGDRRRKWERIVKINENKYALSCGGMTQWDGKPLDVPTHPDKLSPIVFWRDKQGCEFVRVRNSPIRQDNSTYAFLQNYLPKGMSFAINQGKQYLCTYGPHGKQFYLPHPKYNIWAHNAYEMYKDNPNYTYYQNHVPATKIDTGTALTFKRVGDTDWQLVSKAFVEKRKSTRVDKKGKAALKPYLNSLYEQAFALCNMFPRPTKKPVTFDLRGTPQTYMQTDSSQADAFIRHHAEELREYVAARPELDQVNSYWGGKLGLMQRYFSHNPKLTKEVIKDEQHELRIPLLVTMWYTKDLELADLSDSDEVKKARTKMNNMINKLAGLTKTATVTKK